MMKSHPIIVIRRQSRSAAKAQHGGAWKVAFADFTLAMMAFFMVLWIMEVSSVKERAKIAHYMRTHSIFDGSPSLFDPGNSPFPVDLGGSPSIIDRGASNRLPPDNPVPGMSEFLNVPDGTEFPNAGKGKELNSLIEGTFSTPSELGMLLKVFEDLAKEQMAQANILVEVVPSGLRVVIRDDKEHQMFQRGQVVMTPFFEDLLFSLAKVFEKINNKIIISGHSDGTSFNGSSYSNWELSGDRALQARQVLVAGGMPQNRVAQVAAFSSSRLLNEVDKGSSENRRVELLILTPEAKSQLDTLFSSSGNSPAISTAADQARDNQAVMRSGAKQ
jgi:chemotaxis protein MotB